MPINTEQLNRKLYDLLDSRGYQPKPLDTTGKITPVPEEAAVIKFDFIKDGTNYGKVWVSIDGTKNLQVYYGDDVNDSPEENTSGSEYSDTWSSLLKYLKNWAQRRQLGFELKNENHLASDMSRRHHTEKKEKIGESTIMKNLTKKQGVAEGFERFQVGDKISFPLSQMATGVVNKIDDKRLYVKLDNGEVYTIPSTMLHSVKLLERQGVAEAKTPEEFIDQLKSLDKKPPRVTNTCKTCGKKWQLMHVCKGPKKDMGKNKEQVSEGYYPMGKQGSYSDAVPTTKIILQHTRKIEEGEQRYRNVAKIFVENTNGERFLLPTTKPGIARVYARHIAEGGTPYDERGKHITSLVEEYSKMAGFVRATKNKQFNESAQQLINEGLNHYQSLRETLGKLTGRRGYNAYFESYTPTLVEDGIEQSNLNELFVQETLDPRIESVMPILSRLHKKIDEMKEVDQLAEWADSLLETEKDDEEPEHAEWYDKDGKVNPNGAYDAGGHYHLEREVDESAPPGMEKWIKDRKADFKKRYGDRWKEVLYATAWKRKNADESIEEAEGRETLKHNQDTEKHNLKAFGLAEDGNIELRNAEDYKERLKTLQDILLDPSTAKDPLLKREAMRRKAELEHEAKSKGFAEGTYDVQEDLGPEQKRVGQLGPTEKVGKKGAVGKLVGANESFINTTAQAVTTEDGVAEGTGVTDYNPKSQGGTRKELLAKYHKTKDPKDAERARKAGATQKELQGTAKEVNEMDKSAPQPGRDGKVSHSTYGSRDKKGSDYFTGKESPVKPITAKQAEQDALDRLNQAMDKAHKKEVKEGQEDLDAILRIIKK